MSHNFLNASEFWCGSSLPVTSGIKTQVLLVLISMMNIVEIFGPKKRSNANQVMCGHGLHNQFE